MYFEFIYVNRLYLYKKDNDLIQVFFLNG